MIHAPAHPLCWRCIHPSPASVRIDRVPYCRKCARELIAKPLDLKITPLSTARETLAVNV